MGRILLQAADTADGRVRQLRVKLHDLPGREVDRETVVAWMRDGHSLIPDSGGPSARALQLVTVDDQPFIRDDHDPIAEDKLPDLPGLTG